MAPLAFVQERATLIIMQEVQAGDGPVVEAVDAVDHLIRTHGHVGEGSRVEHVLVVPCHLFCKHTRTRTRTWNPSSAV